MSLKFCGKVLLLFNTDYSNSNVQVYPPHKRKEIEREMHFSSFKEVHLIEVSNFGFTVTFQEFQVKYYGAIVKLKLDHPEFKKYSFLEGHSLIIYTDTVGFSEIIKNSDLDFGVSLGKTFSFDLYTNAWFNGCYRLIPDTSSIIPKGISNYCEFWESPKTSSMKAGCVYLDRWGDIYLALTDKVYSSTIGAGYGGGQGNYSLYYSSWSVLHYQPDEKKPATVMVYLGNSKKILEYLPKIGKDCSSLQKFFEDLFQREYNHFSKFSMGIDFLRIKGYSNGHFVKLMEIPGYKLLYNSISGWKGIKEILFNFSAKYSPDSDCGDSISHLEDYFYVTSEKDVEDVKNILSKNEKLIYRKYILDTIKYWKNRSTISDLEKYPDFYAPKKDDEKFTMNNINEFLAWKVARSYLRTSVRNYWRVPSTFLNLGVFIDENDFIDEFEKIRRS